MSDQVLINGAQHSWSSTKLTIDSEPFSGVTAIKFKDALEVAKSYGMGRHHAPRGRSAGKYSVDPVTLTMATSSAEELRRLLAAKSRSGKSYGQVEFPMVLQYVEPGDTTITVEFIRCRYVSGSTSNEEGPDALTEEVEIDCMRIRRNGRTLYEESEA